MRISFLLVLVFLIAAGCATNDDRVVVNELTKNGGVISYCEKGYLGAPKTPEELAIIQMEKKCPSGYSIDRQTKDIKAQHFGFVSGQLKYVTVYFSCKS